MGEGGSRARTNRLATGSSSARNEVGKVWRPVRRARGRLRSEFERWMTRVHGASCGIAVLRLRLADSRSPGRLRPAPLPTQSVPAEWRGGVSLRVGHPPSVLSQRDRAMNILSAANTDSSRDEERRSGGGSAARSGRHVRVSLAGRSRAERPEPRVVPGFDGSERLRRYTRPTPDRLRFSQRLIDIDCWRRSCCRRASSAWRCSSCCCL